MEPDSYVGHCGASSPALPAQEMGKGGAQSFSATWELAWALGSEDAKTISQPLLCLAVGLTPLSLDFLTCQMGSVIILAIGMVRVTVWSWGIYILPRVPS